MRLLLAVGCTLLLYVSVARTADDEDQAAVRKHAERYIAALFKGDKVALKALFHERFEGRCPLGQVTRGRPEAIIHWTAGKSFTILTAKVESIRLFGDTAIEAGTFNADTKDNSTWHRIPYTRVWVKDGKGWRLVHEHF